MAQRLTTDAIREMYPEDRWILLLPTVTKLTSDDSLIYGLDVTEVEINPDSPSMVYDNKGKDALTKVALDRLAAAAGISVSSRRTDDRSNREYASYEATAMIANPGGEPIVRVANREWDGRDAAERIRIECENYVEKGNRGLSDAEFERAVDRRFREEMLREREISRAKTETKAINRAIAMILGVPRSFPRGVLKTHKFAVAKFVLAPDMSDPDIKQAVIAAGFGARHALYAGKLDHVSQMQQIHATAHERHPELLAGPQAHADDHQGISGATSPNEAQAQAHELATGLKQRTDDAIWSEAYKRGVIDPAQPDGRSILASNPRDEIAASVPAAVAELQQAMGGAQILPADGPDAAWRAVEPLLPEVQALLAECKHEKAALAKSRYLAAFKARDAERVQAVYNWLLDQAIEGGK